MNGDSKDWWERHAGQPIMEWFPTQLVAVILAIFAAAIAWFVIGIPVATEQTQVGFRGTGMANLTERGAYRAALAEVDLVPPDDPVIEASADSALAGDVYENVQVLGHLTEDNFLRLMTAITNWVSPDQGCAYCHGEDGNFASEDYYPKIVARRMLQMTVAINSQWKNHVGATGVTCYTCHRGQNVPSYIWFDTPPVKTGVLGWRNEQNEPHPRVSSASLPNTVFERFLADDQPIRVISPEIRNDATGQDIKATEWSFGLMVHMSSGLGVNCAYCHNTRSMNVWEQGPPARTTAWYGIRMARQLNNDYLTPLKPVYPAHRLGPTGDAPKANCLTCHQGVNKPLNGRPMLENWPELAAPPPTVQAMAN
jgi:photosynthetic reaction center cytochrome c subunit